jgi:hypothetical protein
LGDFINVVRHGSLNHQPFESSEALTGYSGLGSSSSASKPSSGASASSGGGGGSSSGGGGGVSTVGAIGAGVKTSLLFGTVSGAIGTILTLTEESFRFFSTLERALKTVMTGIGVGGLSHDDYRGFFNERRSHPQRNFIDGDLVERVLDLDRDDLDAVLRQLNDDLSASSLPKPSASATSSSYSLAAYATTSIFAPSDEKGVTVEECLRRVEEIARLH